MRAIWVNSAAPATEALDDRCRHCQRLPPEEDELAVREQLHDLVDHEMVPRGLVEEVALTVPGGRVEGLHELPHLEKILVAATAQLAREIVDRPHRRPVAVLGE